MSEKSQNKNSHIIQSLVVNLLIALAKGVAAFFTKSGAMLAETIHSFSDCANQLLLLTGVKQAQRPVSAKHPMGQGRAVYFWSFMVAMLLFSIGGMFSIYEGIHKLNSPEPIEHVSWGVGILLFSLCLEGYATFSNVVEINKRRGSLTFRRYLKETKDSDLIVVFGENGAAVLGLIVAILAMLTSYYSGDGSYDAVGSIIIGAILISVAIFLSIEVKSLLVGESASESITQGVNEVLSKHSNVLKLLKCITIQQGPGEVLLCMKIKCQQHITALELSKMINQLEQEIRKKSPEVKWLYIEPDLQEWKES
jgi:cation diffusion facilitator family transporter